MTQLKPGWLIGHRSESGYQVLTVSWVAQSHAVCFLPGEEGFHLIPLSDVLPPF